MWVLKPLKLYTFALVLNQTRAIGSKLKLIFFQVKRHNL